VNSSELLKSFSIRQFTGAVIIWVCNVPIFELPSKEIFSWLVTDTNQVVVAKYCVAMLLPIACL
jgi:hypothetical protein